MPRHRAELAQDASGGARTYEKRGGLHFSEVSTEFGAHLVQDWSQFSGARHLKQTRINGRPWQSAATRSEMPGDNCSPYYPQTNGKLVCFHETLKARLNLLVFTSRRLCERPWRSSSSLTTTAGATKGGAT